MTFHDPDATAEALRGLSALAPDPDRAERLRMRCRRQIGRTRQRRARRAVMADFACRVLAPALAGGFSLVYFAMLVATTLRFEGVL